MQNGDRGVAVTVCIDHLIDMFQNLLIVKAGECWGAIDSSGDAADNALLDERARQLFDAYADGVSDAAECLGDDNLKSIVRAFATHRKMAMTTFVMSQPQGDPEP